MKILENFRSGVCWHVLPEYRDVLLGPGGLLIERWLDAGQAKILKRGPHRTVYHVRLAELDFHVKHYPVPDARAWIRQLVRPSKARGEYQNALAVAGRGVPTFVPLGFGEERTLLGAGDSFLITRTLPQTEPFNTFLETSWPRLSRARRAALAPRLAIALGTLLARMHDAGIFHTDLHAGNLLLRLEEGDRPCFFLIDLHTVALRPSLDWPTSRENLVMLNRWFSLRVSRSDRLRFWQAYCKTRREQRGASREGRGTGSRSFLSAPPSAFASTLWQVFSRPSPLASRPSSELARDLEQRTRESNVNFWLRRDRRCVENNRAYQVIRTTGAAGFAVADLDHATREALISDPDGPFRRPGARLLKDSRSSTVAEVEIMCDGRPCRAIYKRFRVTAWTDPWVAMVRPSAALRSWITGQGLRERSLPTPRPLMVFHRVHAGMQWNAYLLTEKIDNARDLHGFLEGLAVLPPYSARRELRRAIDLLAKTIRHMHRCQLSHRDLKATNILTSRAPTTAVELDLSPLIPPSLWLIDLVGVTRFCRLPRSRRVQNLARLNASFFQNPVVTRTDRLRFLRTYMSWGLLGKEGWKRWWQRIERATRAKVARNLRNQRPLR